MSSTTRWPWCGRPASASRARRSSSRNGCRGAPARVQCEDIQQLAYPVLRHRILTNFTAASEGITTDAVVKKILAETPAREGELTRDERFKKIFANTQ